MKTDTSQTVHKSVEKLVASVERDKYILTHTHRV